MASARILARADELDVKASVIEINVAAMKQHHVDVCGEGACNCCSAVDLNKAIGEAAKLRVRAAGMRIVPAQVSTGSAAVAAKLAEF